MKSLTAVTRPVLRYHGGKYRLAPWIVGFFPSHRAYVEPFGGAASVLLRKPRSKLEVYSDVNDEIVNVFRVLRNPRQAAQLRRLIELTPFARAEFDAAYEHTDDAIERARRTVTRAFLGFGSGAAFSKHATGFRSGNRQRNQCAAFDLHTWPDQVPAFVDRLKGVVIENRDARHVMEQHDSPDTLIYVDPPYPLDTRGNARGVRQKYVQELTDADHRMLASTLHGLRGMVVLSGYPCDLYDRELFAGWERHERSTLADGARRRTEVLWLNPACSAALRAERREAA